MTAPRKVWRVEQVGKPLVGWDIYDGHTRVGWFIAEAEARAVVEAHNATGEAEPVTYRRRWAGVDSWVYSEAPEEIDRWRRDGYDVTPLFAAPPSQIAKVREYRDKYIARAAPEVSTFAVAADEIIKLLEGGE